MYMSFVEFFQSNFLTELCNFIKKRLKNRCFSANIAKFLRTAFFIEHPLWWLLRCRLLLRAQPIIKEAIFVIAFATLL